MGANSTSLTWRDPAFHLDLIRDYRNNVALYPDFEAYFRKYQPPLLAAWGRHDPAFIPAGAEAYKRDNPAAEVHLLNAGHFALETHADEIAALIRRNDHLKERRSPSTT